MSGHCSNGHPKPIEAGCPIFCPVEYGRIVLAVDQRMPVHRAHLTVTVPSFTQLDDYRRPP